MLGPWCPTLPKRSIVEQRPPSRRRGTRARASGRSPRLRPTRESPRRCGRSSPTREAEAALEAAGYAFDGEPAAMFARAGERCRRPTSATSTGTPRPRPRSSGRLNDLAYGYPGGGGARRGDRAARPTRTPPRSYRARVDGEVASRACRPSTSRPDCVIWWVATLPEHRGKRLASRLLQAAARRRPRARARDDVAPGEHAGPWRLRAARVRAGRAASAPRAANVGLRIVCAA